MSKEALDGFRAKLAKDQPLREEMTRALGKGAGQPMASVEELVAFAKSQGYAFSSDEVRQNVELSDEQLDSVAGGAGKVFAKLGDIKGESTDNDHKGWIEILSHG